MKHKLFCILTLICIVVMVPLCSSSATYAELGDTSGISDADFFGVWSSSSKTWTTTPQLDYANFKGLSSVETAVKNSNYTLAKQELLKYYKNRTGITYPSKPYATATYNSVFWAMNDSLAYKDAYLAETSITSTSFTQYTINLGTNANYGRFHLSSLQKSKCND